MKLGVGVCYMTSTVLITFATFTTFAHNGGPSIPWKLTDAFYFFPLMVPFFAQLVWQVISLKTINATNALARFKSNTWAALLLIGSLLFSRQILAALDSILATGPF